MNRMAMLGAIAAVGLVIQIILGFALAGTSDPKASAAVYPHVVIGVLGLALVAYLAIGIVRAGGAKTVRLVYVLALLLTLAQVALGFDLLETSASGDGVVMAHQGIALLILIFMAAGGALSARSRRMSPT